MLQDHEEEETKGFKVSATTSKKQSNEDIEEDYIAEEIEDVEYDGG
jgi:hypothetical protein